MALPALSLAAQAIMRSGAPAALAKYGAKAVQAAKKELAKRSSSLDDMARRQPENLGKPKITPAARKEMGVNRNERGLASEPLKKSSPQGPTNATSYTDKAEAARTRLIESGKLKPGMAGYKKGGKVRGCGVAQRGLTKGRMV
jgi:hypothetical protein